MALDPRTLKGIFLEPFFVRDEGNTNAFLEHLVEAYGKWPKHMINDGGWLWAAFSFWQVEEVITWRVVRGGKRAVIEGFFGEFLKRRSKDFDRYFPTKKGLGSLRRWLQSFAWLHNLIMAVFDRALLPQPLGMEPGSSLPC